MFRLDGCLTGCGLLVGFVRHNTHARAGLKGAEALLREQAAGEAEHGLEMGKFKWWFNYMSWGPGQLEQQIAGGSWDVVEADPAAVLRQGVALERDLW